MPTKDSLGDRMKDNYENRYRIQLPRRTYTIIRIDGRAFHTYTRKLEKPFDGKLTEDLATATIYTLKNIQGAEFAYLQSDEISILLTDFTGPTTDAWFDGNIQKITSVAASIFTAAFNRERMAHTKEALNKVPLATFDARAFVIPDAVEVANYFIWRNRDCHRNYISSVARSCYSHAALQGKSTAELLGMIKKAKVNTDAYRDSQEYGRIIALFPKVEEEQADGYVISPAWEVSPGWKFNMSNFLELVPTYNEKE